MSTYQTDYRFKRQSLTPDQVKTLLSLPDESDILGLREKALLTTMVNMGLRTIEVSRAKVGDIKEYKGRRVLMVWGKGRKQPDQPCVIPQGVMALLKKYLDRRNNATPKSPLFTSRTGKVLSTREIRSIVRDYFDHMGLPFPQYSAHSLRHTAATLKLQAGVDVNRVRTFMRHSSLHTTSIYAHDVEEFSNPVSEIGEVS